MADVQLTRDALAVTKRLAKFIPGRDPTSVGVRPVNRQTFTQDGLLQDFDVEVPVRDGTILRANIHRPASRKDEPLPVILNYSVYGKDGGAIDICMFPPTCGVDPSRISKHYIFEAADPGWWCEKGFAVATVDARGCQNSEGDKGYYSRDVGLDGYDIVEWLANQAWSNGNVAMYGASAYAMVQWLVAAENPPSLKAIIPIDGMTDVYREVISQGGIPETHFTEFYPLFWNWGRNQIEDTQTGRDHPYFDEYWKSKIPALERIQCPAYVISGWGDHGLHTRGTLHGWKTISSEEKYLEIHQCQKWEWSVTEESLARQKAFLEKYLLHRTDTEVELWPKVRYTMRERFYVGEWRFANNFPIDTTEYTKLFLTNSQGLSIVPPGKAQSVSYDARSEEVVFDLPIFQSSLEFAGHAKLRLWVEAQDADDMDLFITLRKVDSSGKSVGFAWFSFLQDGPIGFGFMRVSRRELDTKLSTPYYPVQAHQRDLTLSPGEIVPVDIEILPSSCRLRPGERLQINISGHDYGSYPPHLPLMRHSRTKNAGKHFIHFGGHYDSHLLLPVIPAIPNSYSKINNVKMFMVASRYPGWSDEKFLNEYTGVHATMTQEMSNQVPTMRNYTQVLAIPSVNVEAAKAFGSSDDSWDCVSIMGWSSVRTLWGSLHSPEYLSSEAGKHVYTDSTRLLGLVATPEVDIVLLPIELEERGKGSVLVVLLLAKCAEISAYNAADVAERADIVTRASNDSGLLRYCFNKAIDLEEFGGFFNETPFKDADFETLGGVEQYWFTDMKSAEAWLTTETSRQAVQSLPGFFDARKSLMVVGAENRVVCKEREF